MSTDAAKATANGIAARLESLGDISVRRFFGGASLSASGVQFAFVMGTALYVRVDEESRQSLEGAGSFPFVYESAFRLVNVSKYWELPASLLEDDAILLSYATKAISTATVGRASKLKPKRAV